MQFLRIKSNDELGDLDRLKEQGVTVRNAVEYTFRVIEPYSILPSGARRGLRKQLRSAVLRHRTQWFPRTIFNQNYAP